MLYQTRKKQHFPCNLFGGESCSVGIGQYRAYSIITNKDDLHKENARIKQVLKENGYLESIISKIFKRITNNHSLPQLQQQTQAANIQEEEIKTLTVR